MTRNARIDLSTHESHVRAVQQVQRGLAESALGGMRDGLGLPAPSSVVGTHQRLSTRVPTAGEREGTVISVGRRAQGRGYDGYGLTTVAHVAIDAHGGEAESTATLQSNGQLLLQSDDESAYLVSEDPAVVASAAMTQVIGSQGVLVSAGTEIEVENATIEGSGPVRPTAMAAQPGLLAAVSSAWAKWKADAVALLQKRDVLALAMDPSTEPTPPDELPGVDAAELGAATVDRGALPEPPEREGPSVFDVVRGALGLESPVPDAIRSGAEALLQKGVDKLVGGDDEDAGEPPGAGLVMQAEGGILASTPGFAVVHGDEAVIVSSAAVSTFGKESVEVVAGESVTMQAQETTAITSGKDLTLQSAAGPTELSAQAGELTVVAPKIAIGATQPEPPQGATGSLEMEAGAVKITTAEVVPTGGGDDEPSDEGGLFIESHDVIDAKAEATVSVQAGESITLKVETEQKTLTILIDSEGKITLSAGDDVSLAISEDDGLVFSDQEELLTLTSDGCFMGVDSDNSIEITSNEVTISGSSIEIG